jgi:L-alanine-DL-glutamate epimerase-like enolase superfamily enzyme
VSATRIERIDVTAYRIPTDAPESDGTFEWDATTLVYVEARAQDLVGVGYTYADPATAMLIRAVLGGVVTGCDAMDVPRIWAKMVRAIRNSGRPGIASMAISAIDAALWDLKAKALRVPLVTLLGSARDAAEVYGSGGFTSYTADRLEEQLAGWTRSGIKRVKMKIGRDPVADVARVRLARAAIGDAVALFVDANGAYSRAEALAQAVRFAEQRVTWFEEPVSSDDLEGLRFLRDRAPAGMAIAAGEYGYAAEYFRRMLEAGAVDILQADASRCGGITGFLQVDAECHARSMQLSAHCAPSLHVHVACAAQSFVHLEYFHDHVRIEHAYFDGALTPKHGRLEPDRSRPGLGLELKKRDIAKYELSVR